MSVTRKSLAGFSALAALACAALFHGGCEGTSSGVDNPSLSVTFRDNTGAALRVTGDLDVFAADQNPAVDPQPLWTVKVPNRAVAKLTFDDIDRIEAAGKVAARAAAGGAAKPGAGDATFTPDAKLQFNLVFRGQSLTGALIFGLGYDPALRSFTSDGARIEGVDARPAPLSRFHASIASAGLHLDGVTRVYIPGTPYATPLTDSGFVFENLPIGIFDLRVLAQDGRVLQVKEQLSSAVSMNDGFTLDSVPIDTLGPKPLPIPTFRVVVDSPQRDTIRELKALLAAHMVGISPTEPGLLTEWKLIRPEAADTAHRPFIANPNALQTPVTFKSRGPYVFQVSATFVQKTVFDTLYLAVLEPLAVARNIISPRADDTVTFGDTARIVWSPPFLPGPLRFEVSINKGETWVGIGESPAGLDTLFAWIPDTTTLRESPTSQIRITPGLDTAHAIRSALFNLLKRQH